MRLQKNIISLVTAVLLFSGISLAQSNWEWVSPVAGVTDMVYAENLYVGVAGNTIITSKDGKKWENHFLAHGLQSIVYGNGKFVAMTHGDMHIEIYTSTDGENWSESYSKRFDYSMTMLDIAFGNNTFVIVGTGGTIMTSTDGVSWMDFRLNDICELVSVAFGNGIFLAVRNDYHNVSDSLFISADGNTWHGVVSPVNTVFSSITFGNGLFLASEKFGDSVFVSADGRNWSGSQAETFLPDPSSTGIANGNFYVFGMYGSARKSTDGITWEEQHFGTAKTLRTVTYGDSGYVIAGETIIHSRDGLKWTEFGQVFKGDFLSIAYGNNTFVAVADSLVAASADGINWFTSRSCEPRCSWTRVAFRAGKFVLQNSSGDIDTSSDGFYWGRVDDTLDEAGAKVYRYTRQCDCYTIATGNGKTIGLKAQSQPGTGIILINGGECTELPIASEYVTGNCIVFGGGIFVIVNKSGKIFTSADGENWTNVYTNIMVKFRSIAYGNNRYVAVGEDGAIVISPADNPEMIRLVPSGTAAKGRLRLIPAGSHLTVVLPPVFEPCGVTVRIINIAGRTVFADQFFTERRELRVPAGKLKQGMYIISISDVKWRKASLGFVLTR